MSEKSKKIAELMSSVQVEWVAPSESKDVALLDLGLMCVLLRSLTDVQAERTLKALRAAYPDWNELRISQVQEFFHHVQSKRADVQVQVARDVREYLQEIFQRNHGFDLEFMRRDAVEAAKFVQQLSFLGASAAHYLLWCANDQELPVTNGIIRTLDRLGVMKRTSSVRKAQALLEPHLPPEMRRDFAIRMGLVVERWCDAKKPTCWECVLVAVCPFGKKVSRDWKAQQQRLEVQRKRDQERRVKEEEKARRRAEAEARRHSRELERVKKQDERKRALEEARRVREEAKKRAAAERAEVLARKKALAEREAAAKRKKAAPAAARKKGTRPAGKPASPPKRSPTTGKAQRKGSDRKR